MTIDVFPRYPIARRNYVFESESNTTFNAQNQRLVWMHDDADASITAIERHHAFAINPWKHVCFQL